MAETGNGATDEEVLTLARDRDAILLTADKDFGDLIHRQQALPSGIVLLRLAGLSTQAKADAVLSVVRDHGLGLRASFAVVSPGLVRIRTGA